MNVSWFHPELNSPCCPDVSKGVCYGCRRHIPTRLSILAHNLAVAGGLCETWQRCAMTIIGVSEWRPGHALPLDSDD